AYPQYVKMSDLGKDERAEWQRSRYFLLQHISNYVHTLVYNQCSDPTRDILLTPAGKYEGGKNKSAVAPNPLALLGTPW
ncbi:MAG: hypothetical protein ACKPKO_16085, partial [Candidatus Fonsibacter sp.]